jgi:hypothetical protein
LDCFEVAGHVDNPRLELMMESVQRLSQEE